MTALPFAVAARDGVVSLTLDTPNCAVNIFDNRAASQLVEILGNVDPATTRAVVLESGKPGSFVNGVGLLMATTVRSPESAMKLSAGVRAAYRALREASVPTIAAIRGNAYGCGVELALQCDHRVAADSFDTHFYMTELNDYLFNPVFGATVTLPLVLGLEQACELLLWGARWPSGVAKRRGLIDAVLPSESFERAVDEAVAQLVRRRPRQPRRLSKERIDAIAARHQARIKRMPPAYHRVYRRCLALMTKVARQGKTTERDRMREVVLSGESAASQQAKQALSFFFVRQTAHTLALAGAATPLRALVRCRSTHAPLRAFVAELSARKLAGVTITRRGSHAAVADGFERFVLVPPGSRSAPRASETRVQVVLTPGEPVPGRAQGNGDIVLYGLRGAESRLLEIACHEVTPHVRALYDLLTRAGYRAAITHPDEAPVVEQFLSLQVAMATAYVAHGGDTVTLDSTLRRFGFVRRMPELIAGLEWPHLTKALRRALAGAAAGIVEPMAEPALERALARLRKPSEPTRRYDRRLVAGLTIGWLQLVRRLLESEQVTHPTVVDVIARELIDFPLCKGSLAAHLTRTRLRDRLALRPPSWLTDDAIRGALTFAAGSRDFYLQRVSAA